MMLKFKKRFLYKSKPNQKNKALKQNKKAFVKLFDFQHT